MICFTITIIYLWLFRSAILIFIIILYATFIDNLIKIDENIFYKIKDNQ